MLHHAHGVLSRSSLLHGILLFTLVLILTSAGTPSMASICPDLKGGPGDVDGDGLLQGSDCDDGDASLASTPGEALDLLSTGPSPGGHVYVWSTPASPGGSAVLAYDVLRSVNAGNFAGPGAVCLEASDTDLTFEDSSTLAPGQVAFFLIRPLNACGGGDIGAGSRSGQVLPRTALACDCTQLCDDADACTTDSCAGGGTCLHTAIEPVVLRTPDPAAVCAGSDAPFRVAAAGSGNLSYQWFLNGGPTGVDSPLLLLPSVSAADNNSVVTVQVTDGCASTTSPPAVLTVHPDAASCSGGLAGQEPPAQTVMGDDTARNTGSVHLHSGEFTYRRVDLSIPGVGLDLVWGLTYRSRESRQGRMGFQWVDSYDRRVAWQNPATPVRLLFHDGSTGRVDLYTPDPVGCWDSPGQFALICPDPTPNQGFRLTTASGAVYVFNGLDGSPAEGRILQVLDRNGNSLSMAYDAAGRLTTITDTLGRPTTLAYDAQGRVISVSDFSGRSVTYAYYQNGEFGGEPGDLKSTTSPAVTGTPSGNDFPQGTTHLFTYTQGAALADLNHNLLTIRDPQGQVVLRNIYTSAESPADPRFDRMDRQVYFSDPPAAGTGQVRALTYVTQTPTAANNFARSKTLLQDRAGNLSSHFFDSQGRLVLLNRHTGRAPDPLTPTGEVLNQPVNPVRASDPPVYVTRLEYNADSLVTRVVQHNQSDMQFVYDSANPSVRLRANLLSTTRLPGPLGGDQASITESWTYATPLGTEVCAGISEVCLSSVDADAMDWYQSFGGLGGVYGGEVSWWGNAGGGSDYGKVFPKVDVYLSASSPGGLTKWVDKSSPNLMLSGGGITHTENDAKGKKKGHIPYGWNPGKGTAGSITKWIDKSSPDLMLHATAGGVTYTENDSKGKKKGHIGPPGGSSAGVSLTKWIDKSSPNLMLHAGGGDMSVTKWVDKSSTVLLRSSGGRRYPRYLDKSSPDLMLQAGVGGGCPPYCGSNDSKGKKKGPIPYDPTASAGTGDWWGSGTASASASVRLFIKIANVVGESATHRVRKASPRYIDKSTPKLYQACGGACGGGGSPSASRRRGDVIVEDVAIRTPGHRSFPGSYTDGRGTVVTLIYDPSGNLTQVTQPATTQNGGLPPQNIVDQFQYDSSGRVTLHIDPEGRQDVYTYHTLGPQTGYLAGVVVDDLGLQLSHSFTYDAVGNLTAATDPRGNTSTLVHNAHNRLVQTLSPPPFSFDTTIFYAGNGTVTRVDVEDPDLVALPRPYLSTHYEYDGLNRVVRTRAEVDELTDACVINEFQYTPNDKVAQVRLGEAVNGIQPGNALLLEYDERDLLYRARAADGQPEVTTTQYDYDGNANLVSIQQGLEDPVGPHLTTASYDGYDRLLSTTGTEGSVSSHHYDANGNVVSSQFDGETVEGVSGTNVLLKATAIIYDEMNRPLQLDESHFDTLAGTAILDGNSTLRFIYNARSQQVQLEDDTGSRSSQAYDSAGRLSQVTDSGLNTRVFAYDAGSNVVSLTETDEPTLPAAPAQVFVSTFTYDELDRLTTHEDPLGHLTGYDYDGRGHVVQVTDAEGNVSRTEYDGLSRPVRNEFDMTDNGLGTGTVVDTLVSTATYDDSHRLVSEVDFDGNTTLNQYDALDRLVTTTMADGTAHTFAWDVHDDQVSSSDANGTALTMDYDRLHRTVQVTASLGASVQGSTFETYQYDGLGRVVRGENDHSVVTFDYDSLGNSTRETLLIDGAPPVLVNTASYDGDGNLLSIVTPAGRTFTGTYDALDRLTAVSEGALGPVVLYDYIGPTRVLRRSLANSVVTDYAYDGDGRMSRTTHTQGSGPGATTLVDYTYAYDAMDNKLERSDLLAGGEFERFSYDSLYRMVGSSRGVPGVTTDIDYDLDRSGNRLTVTGGPDAGAYVLDPAIPPADAQVHQYTTTPRGGRLYDENGNLLFLDGASASQRDNAFDFRNRMVVSSLPANPEVHYHYDVLSRRISRSVLNGPTLTPEHRWAYYLGTCLQEEDVLAGTTTLYLEVAGEPLRVDPGAGGSYYLHADDLGSVTAVTDVAGSVVERADYGDFGQPVITDATGGLIPVSGVGNPYLFRGRRYEGDTTFYYLGEGLYFDTPSGRPTSRENSEKWRGRHFMRSPWTGGFTKAAHDAAMNSIRNMK